MKSQSIVITTFLLLITISARAQAFDMIVSKTAPGAYRTIQAAIDRVADNKTTRTLIFIKNGTYAEKVVISSAKTNISLIGESAEGVIITWNDYQGKGSITGATSYTLWADGADLYIENVTIKNTAGNVGQAVAIRTTGERQVFKNCRFYGYQDTYYANKNRQYNLNCYIEGGTDFIYGDATTVFDSCTVNCVKGGSYIAAPADSKLLSKCANGDTIFHGLLFNKCNITANADVSPQSYYLGRTWAVPGSAIYKNCILGNHINTVGWYNWNGTKGRYGEYKSRDSNGNLIDVSGRVSWSVQLSDDYATNYYTLDSFLCKNKIVWNPIPITVALAFPSDLNATKNQLIWTAVDQAKGYVIIRNDSVVGFSASNTYTDATANSQTSNTYKVKSVSSNGNLSNTSGSVTVDGGWTLLNKFKDASLKILITNKHLLVPENLEVKIYSASGNLIMSVKKTRDISLESLKSGLYIIKAFINKNLIEVQKITL